MHIVVLVGHQTADLNTIPIAIASPSGSVQSGFNEVAHRCGAATVPRDLTEASRFP